MVRKADGKNPTVLGRALVKSRAARKNVARREGARVNEIYHNTNEEDTEEQANLQSVMERNALDEFLTTAIMKEQTFTANKKQSVIMVGGSAVVAVQEKRNLEELEYENIRIPRRPKWDFTMEAEELQRLERDAFLDWRRNLAKYEETSTDKTATPFEKNMEVWKQLWRVAERSHVVAQVVDARNPLLFYCEDLFTLSKELDERKENVLIINKSDFLTREARKVWADYFTGRGIRFIFWSAKKEQEILDLQTEKEKEKEELRMAVVEAAKLKAKKMLLKAYLAKRKAAQEAKAQEAKAKVVQKPAVLEQDDEGESGVMRLKVYKDNEDNHHDDDQDWDVSDSELDYDKFIDRAALADIDEMKVELPVTKIDMASRDPTRIVNYEELLDYFKYIANQEYVHATYVEAEARIMEKKALGGESLETHFQNDTNHHPLLAPKKESNPIANVLNKAKVVVGLLGFPNVGKSSTINALVGAKKVSVSSTAGHTKHFQTLNLGDGLMLCDCPGLVFPTFVHSKSTLIVNGVIPVDSLRDYFSPVDAICSRISRTQITQLYGLDIPKWKQLDAITLLQCHATMRGFYKDKGRPDESRSARIVLKDFIAGKLLYCQTPPNLTAEQRNSFYASFSKSDAFIDSTVLPQAVHHDEAPVKTSTTLLAVNSHKPLQMNHQDIDMNFDDTEDRIGGFVDNPDVIDVHIDRKRIVTVNPEVDTVQPTREKTQKERLEELQMASMSKKQLLRMRNNLLKGKQAPISGNSGVRMVGSSSSKKFYGTVFDEEGRKVRQ